MNDVDEQTDYLSAEELSDKDIETYMQQKRDRECHAGIQTLPSGYENFAAELAKDLQENIETAKRNRKAENQKTLWGRMKNLFISLLEDYQGLKP